MNLILSRQRTVNTKKNYEMKNSYNNSRHNSGGENLSWRKGSNADNMKENNNYLRGLSLIMR